MPTRFMELHRRACLELMQAACDNEGGKYMWDGNAPQLTHCMAAREWPYFGWLSTLFRKMSFKIGQKNSQSNLLCLPCMRNCHLMESSIDVKIGLFFCSLSADVCDKSIYRVRELLQIHGIQTFDLFGEHLVMTSLSILVMGILDISKPNVIQLWVQILQFFNHFCLACNGWGWHYNQRGVPNS